MRIPSVRGEIRDRNGVPLVAIAPATRWISTCRTWCAATRSARTRPRAADDLSRRRCKADAQGARARPTSCRSSTRPSSRGCRSWTWRRTTTPSGCRSHYRNDTEIPFTYLEELDFKTIAKFSEHNVGLPGVEIALRPGAPVRLRRARRAPARLRRRAAECRSAAGRRQIQLLPGRRGRENRRSSQHGQVPARPAGRARPAAQCERRDRMRSPQRPAKARQQCLSHARCARANHRRAGAAASFARAARRRSSSIRTTAKSSAWARCRPSIRTFSSRAFPRRIGTR